MDSVRNEKENLSSLRQHTAAWLLGIAPSQLSISDAPRNRDKSYNGKHLVEWYVRHLAMPVSTPQSDADEVLFATGADSPGLERCRIAKANLLELDLAARRKELHSRQAVRDMLARFAAELKRTGDRLGQRHGHEAATLLRESLEECQRIVDETLGGNGHFHSDTQSTDATG